MESRDTILSNLSGFTGTTHWYRILQKVLITDGARYLADAAEAHWLINAIATRISGREHKDSFAVAKLVVVASAATLTLDDGNGNVFVTQDMLYTDFPLDEITLYCEWNGVHWVILLPGEH